MMKFCDTHIHLTKCCKNDFFSFKKNNLYYALASVRDKNDFAQLKNFCDDNIFISYGIPPQDLLFQNAKYRNEFLSECNFLEKLLHEKKITAIGEVGLDFFSHQLQATSKVQLEAWETYIELAIQYSVPLVIHNRKAFEQMFRYTPLLSRVPSVIFHSFAFTFHEANALLNHKVNAFFSFGKSILKKNKRQIECVQMLPLNRILLETDAPFQTLKGQEKTHICEIKNIYFEASKIRKIDLEKFCEKIWRNFFIALSN